MIQECLDRIGRAALFGAGNSENACDRMEAPNPCALLFSVPTRAYLDLLNRVDSALTYERELRQQWEEDLLQSCRALEDDRVKDALQTSKEAADAVVKDEPAGFSGAK